MRDVVTVGAQLTHEIGKYGEGAVEWREIGVRILRACVC